MTVALDDAALARAVAEEAGALLMAIRAEGAEVGKALGARGDHVRLSREAL